MTKTLFFLVSISLVACQQPKVERNYNDRFTVVTQCVEPVGVYHITDKKTGVEYLTVYNGGIIKLEK